MFQGIGQQQSKGNNVQQYQVYKEKYQQAPWMHWPEAARSCTPEFAEDLQSAVDFYSFLQYLSFQQMEAVHRYAATRGVLLLGDLPILVSPDSVDVWAKPHLFNLQFDAGAPPDYYNRLGQRWGFPIYNWDAMRTDQFQWWKERLRAIGTYADLYRIDHVVGYFRIWAIPKDKEPQEGHFFPPHPSDWPKQGREILEMMLTSSPLLPIAEDLGTIPKEVRISLKELGICSTKVMRWERSWEEDGNFTPYNQYDPLSLTTVSTPDSETLTLWWQKFPEEASAFAKFKQWHYTPELSLDHRKQILRDSHHTPSYFHINLLQETLALFPELIWPNPEDERINTPGTQLPTNWTYRFKPYVEEIISHPELAEAFQQLIK